MQPPAGSQVSRVPAQRTPPEQLVPPSGTPTPVRRPGRVRTVITVVAGVLGLLLVGGGITAFVLYDRATRPDRSAPDVVVDNYLRAFLVDRNDIKADQFTCSTSTLETVNGLRSEIEQREARFGVDVRISWGALTRTKTAEGESVETTLTISSSANGQPRSSRREAWVFQVNDDADGWRICDGRKTS
ncbi:MULTISPECIES: hypothetical protein [unclassified Micromonospora]|uniref:hypothetical protein n=1 Tax=unclassified Micromonospora TaxID=2617518 RepID=UPI003628C9C4